MSEDLFSKRESLNTSDNLLVRYDRKISETTSFQLTTDIGRMDKEQTEVVPDHSLIVNERTFLNQVILFLCHMHQTLQTIDLLSKGIIL